MLKFTSIMTVAVISLMVFGACAGSQDQTLQTEVDGPIVSEADHDPDREFSDEEVASFAAAHLEVTAIQQQYQVQMEDAEAGERDRLIAESRAKTEEAMADHGMTPAEYNDIAVRLPDDDELRSRVRTAIQDIEQQRIEETEQQLENQ